MKRIQRSFAGGELSPFVIPLTSLKKRINGLKKSKDGIIRKFGSYEGRGGTEYLHKDKGDFRLFPFEDSVGDSATVLVRSGSVEIYDENFEPHTGVSGYLSPLASSTPDLRLTNFAQEGNLMVITNPFYSGPISVEWRDGQFYVGLFQTARPDAKFTGFGMNSTQGLRAEASDPPREFAFALTGVLPDGRESEAVYVNEGQLRHLVPPGQRGQVFNLAVTEPDPEIYQAYNVYFKSGGVYYLLAVVQPGETYQYLGEPVDTTQALPVKPPSAGGVGGFNFVGGRGDNITGKIGALNASLEFWVTQGASVPSGPWVLQSDSSPAIDYMIVRLTYSSPRRVLGMYFDRYSVTDYENNQSVPAGSWAGMSDTQYATGASKTIYNAAPPIEDGRNLFAGGQNLIGHIKRDDQGFFRLVRLKSLPGPVFRGGPYRLDFGGQSYACYVSGTEQRESFHNGIFESYDILDYKTGQNIPAPAGGTYTAEADYLTETAVNILEDVSNNPIVPFFYGQRLWFGGTLRNPGKITGSSLGQYRDFGRMPVLTQGNSFDFEIFFGNNSGVKYLQAVRELMVFGGASEWSLGADTSPTGISPSRQSSYGVGDVAPVATENSILFAAGKNIVRDFGYNFQSGGYKGNDLSIFASHLFEGKEIVSMAFQRRPDPILWCVMDDGSVRSLTYFAEQQISAWSQHNLGRKALEVFVANEFQVSHVYFKLQDGDDIFIERLAQPDITDDRTFRYADSHKFVDLRNKDAAKTVRLESTATVDPYSPQDTSMTLTLTGHEFDPMPNFIDLLDTSGYIRLFVTGVTTPKTKFMVRVDDEVPRGFHNTPTPGWSLPVKEVDGLDHLNNKQVSVFADGSVISSPNNPQAQHLQVVAGKVALGGYYSTICVGLPFVSDAITLPIDLRGEDTVVDQNMNVNKMALYVHNTRGLFVGSREPASETSVDGLVPLKTNFDGDPEVRPENGIVQKVITGNWSKTGEIIVRQVDPLPMNLQGIVLFGDLIATQRSR